MSRELAIDDYLMATSDQHNRPCSKVWKPRVGANPRGGEDKHQNLKTGARRSRRNVFAKNSKRADAGEKSTSSPVCAPGPAVAAAEGNSAQGPPKGEALRSSVADTDPMKALFAEEKYYRDGINTMWTAVVLHDNDFVRMAALATNFRQWLRQTDRLAQRHWDAAGLVYCEAKEVVTRDFLAAEHCLRGYLARANALFADSLLELHSFEGDLGHVTARNAINEARKHTGAVFGVGRCDLPDRGAGLEHKLRTLRTVIGCVYFPRATCDLCVPEETETVAVGNHKRVYRNWWPGLWRRAWRRSTGETIAWQSRYLWRHGASKFLRSVRAGDLVYSQVGCTVDGSWANDDINLAVAQGISGAGVELHLDFKSVWTIGTDVFQVAVVTQAPRFNKFLGIPYGYIATVSCCLDADYGVLMHRTGSGDPGEVLSRMKITDATAKRRAAWQLVGQTVPPELTASWMSVQNAALSNEVDLEALNPYTARRELLAAHRALASSSGVRAA